ncbi:DNA-binding protein [bacterium (Candidatus Blackallbacteria) CG18_big_fil_WC_8_21_14_2_50_49_26]|nr:MAG: DNA-binding protein [bacterium (Candidatus Blackallbacteria) CG18_big_fil_WC_8_21_14_2_50_49_26]
MSSRLLTREEARHALLMQGKTIRQWARENGFNEKTVYAVMHGLNKGNYGAAHNVAVLLGIKEGWCTNEHQ